MPALFSLQEIAEAFGIRPQATQANEANEPEQAKKEPEQALPVSQDTPEPEPTPQQGGEGSTQAEPNPPAPAPAPAKESIVPPAGTASTPNTIEEIINQPVDKWDEATLRKLFEAKHGVRS